MSTKSILPRFEDSPQDNRINKIISIVTALLVFMVAIGSFALSYSNLRLLAQESGIAGFLSYVWPLLIDASLIVFSLAVVNAYLQSESTWKQWSLVGIYSIATVSFNVAHAPNSLQAQIVASIAPISLFFSFELLMGQLKSSVSRHGLARRLSRTTQEYQKLETELNQKRNEVTELDSRVDELVAQIHSLTMQKESASDTAFKPGDLEALKKANDTRQAKVRARREKVQNLLDLNMTQQQIANELEVSLPTIKRDVKALNGRVS